MTEDKKKKTKKKKLAEYLIRFEFFHLDCLDSFSDLEFFLFLFHAFGDRFKGSSNNWYHSHLHPLQLHQARSKYFSGFSVSFIFTLWCAGTTKSTILQVTFFSSIETKYLLCILTKISRYMHTTKKVAEMIMVELIMRKTTWIFNADLFLSGNIFVPI